MATGLPSATLVEIEFSAGVWTDVGSLVKGDSIEIHVGRDSASSGVQPGTLDLDLDNADGRFTPDNPTSTYYPNFVEGKRIRVRVTKSATTYVRFVGRITSLEPSFPTGDPAQSVTHLAAVDILGDLARTTLPSYPEALARLNDPWTAAFYPLTDANEHAGMADILGVGTPLEVWDRNPGTGHIDARADDSLGDDQSYVQLFDGKGLWHVRPLPQTITSPNALVALVVKVSSSSYGDVICMSDTRRTGATEFVEVRWTSTGFIIDTYVGGVLTGSSTGDGATEGWHYLYLDASNGTLSGGAGGGTSPGAAPTEQLRYMSLGGDLDMTVGQVIIANSAATYVYDATVVNDTNTVLGVDVAQLTSVVGGTGLSATLAWSTNPSTRGATAIIKDKSALDAALELANSQTGVLYAEYSTSATQTVRLLATVDSRPSTVALTVDAEGDLSGGPTLQRSIGDRVTSATATSFIGAVTVIDPAVDDVGTATVDIPTTLGDVNDLHAVASDRIARGRDAKTRVTQLTVDLANASNDLYASFFALTPGERLRLSGLPTTYFGLSYIDGYVEGWTERPGVTGYEVVFDLSPADAPPEAVADDATYADAGFGDGICTVTSGTAVGTTSTGTIVLTWTGSSTLSTAAGDYPQTFDWNGEHVTVTSAPAGSTSPQTLTITARGVAPTVARSHSAGEAIDIRLAAAVAL